MERVMPKTKPKREAATLYDFRDVDILYRIAEEMNGAKGIPTTEIAELLGFEEGDNRPMGIRLAWMRKYGMVLFDEKDRLWRLSAGARRVIAAREQAREIEVVDRLPDESMVEVMAHVTSRYRHGQSYLAHLLRREFLFGTQKR
jgi:hypothetical protein